MGDAVSAPPTAPCTCQGGRRFVECCDGAGGCPCRGDIVDAGECQACGGLGERVARSDRTEG